MRNALGDAIPWTMRFVVNVLLGKTAYKTRMTGTGGRGHPRLIEKASRKSTDRGETFKSYC